MCVLIVDLAFYFCIENEYSFEPNIALKKLTIPVL